MGSSIVRARGRRSDAGARPPGDCASSQGRGWRRWPSRALASSCSCWAAAAEAAARCAPAWPPAGCFTIDTGAGSAACLNVPGEMPGDDGRCPWDGAGRAWPGRALAARDPV